MNQGLLPEDLTSRGVPPHGQIWGAARSFPQTRAPGQVLTSLASLVETTLGQQNSAVTSTPLGNYEGVLQEVSVCNGQVAPLPFPLVNTPICTGPSFHPTLLCHCLFNCLYATSEFTLHEDRDRDCLL